MKSENTACEVGFEYQKPVTDLQVSSQGGKASGYIYGKPFVLKIYDLTLGTTIDSSESHSYESNIWIEPKRPGLECTVSYYLHLVKAGRVYGLLKHIFLTLRVRCKLYTLYTFRFSC